MVNTSTPDEDIALTKEDWVIIQYFGLNVKEYKREIKENAEFSAAFNKQ